MLQHGRLDDSRGAARRKIIRHDGWRVGSMLVLIAVFSSLRGYVDVALCGAPVLFVVIGSGMGFGYVLLRLLLAVPFALAAVVMLPLASGSGTWGLAGLLLLKLVLANLAITYILGTTPVPQLLRTLRRLRLPGPFTDMIGFTLRYITVLSEEAVTMLTAQQARGLRARSWTDVRSYRRMGRLLGVLLERTLERSERIHQSMLARGFHPDAPPVPEAALAPEAAASYIKKGGSGMEAILVEHLSHRYPDATPALHDVSFAIPAGSKTAMLGPNGAGKSTLVQHLNGLFLPQAGSVRIMGEAVGKKSVRQIRTKVGVVFQNPDDQVFASTVWEDVIFGPANMGLPASEIAERSARALDAVGMLEHKDRAPYHLSYGQKKRVAVAGVLAMQPDIIVLDEPMAYLDPRGKDDLAALLELLHRMGKTVLVTTHDVDFAAEWADQVLLLKEGRLLAAGGPELLADPRWVEEAHLHMPKVARPFLLARGIPPGRLPLNEREAARYIEELYGLRSGSGESSSRGG
ncbi:ATP-binding cassette domain-containing protein [Gorillibacterium sp. sgz5001074]|uniref:ATP-binding cassette domain-containing protein n=1 Tax=Gorillibacterium sp. sgz5001074 TaxID=3446695 RepID=UPI003F67E9AA